MMAIWQLGSGKIIQGMTMATTLSSPTHTKTPRQLFNMPFGDRSKIISRVVFPVPLV